MLRCPLCGSLNYEITLFVFSASIEKLVECRNCGASYEEVVVDDPHQLLAFVSDTLVEGAT